MIMNKFVCARPIHPGEVIKDEIEYRGITQGNLQRKWECHTNC